MLRRERITLLALACAACAQAAIWRAPAAAGPAMNVRALPAESGGLWSEFGLQAAEEADFGRYRATAYRFADTTGSYAASRWLAASHPGAAVLGTIVVTCSGACPKPASLVRFLDPADTGHTTFPMLPGYLPRGSIAGSERYIVGPESLAAFVPGVPASALAFQFSAEAITARYPGNTTLLIVSYPTPSMARQQLAEFVKLPGATARRSGPLVAVVLSPADSAAAARLLGSVRYSANVVWDEKPPDSHIMGKLEALILGIGELILFVIALCVVGGLAVGGVRVIARRFGYSSADEGVIALHLSDK